MAEDEQDEACKTFLKGLRKEIYFDQSAVNTELGVFIKEEDLTRKLYGVTGNLSWETWCSIWCESKHHRNCPRSEAD